MQRWLSEEHYPAGRACRTVNSSGRRGALWYTAWGKHSLKLRSNRADVWRLAGFVEHELCFRVWFRLRTPCWSSSLWSMAYWRLHTGERLSGFYHCEIHKHVNVCIHIHIHTKIVFRTLRISGKCMHLLYIWTIYAYYKTIHYINLKIKLEIIYKHFTCSI